MLYDYETVLGIILFVVALVILLLAYLAFKRVSPTEGHRVTIIYHGATKEFKFITEADAKEFYNEVVERVG